MTAGSFFTTDEHVFFAQASEMEFGWRFLSEPIYDHFSPWHRLLDHAVAELTDQGWWLALAISLAWYAATLALFAVLVRSLVGDHWAGTAAIVVLALSPVFVQATQWWALSTQLYPQLAFTFATLICGLRWSASRRRRWLALALVAYALALCAFIKALLALPLLALVLYLRPDTRDRLLPALRRDALLWAGLLALTGVYAAIVTDDRYYRFIGDQPSVAASVWLKYLAAAWGEGIAPLTLGATVPDRLGPGNVLVLVVANLTVAAVVVATLRACPRAWRTWLGALLVVAAALVMSARARLAEFGAEGLALEVRFNAEAAIALLLAAALALHATRIRPPRWTAPAGIVLVAAFAADAGLRLQDGWLGPRHRAYFDRFERTWSPRVDIIDAASPHDIVPVTIVPWNLLSEVLPEREPRVRVGRGEGAPATVTHAGAVVPVELERLDERSPGCAPFRLEVAADGPEDVVVLTLARRPPLAALDATVVADSGIPGGATIRGFPFPQVTSTHLRMEAGQRVKRVAVGYGPVRTVAINPSAAGALCVESLAVERFPLP
jgi:hypothetical protein